MVNKRNVNNIVSVFIYLYLFKKIYILFDNRNVY